MGWSPFLFLSVDVRRNNGRRQNFTRILWSVKPGPVVLDTGRADCEVALMSGFGAEDGKVPHLQSLKAENFAKNRHFEVRGLTGSTRYGKKSRPSETIRRQE